MSFLPGGFGSGHLGSGSILIGAETRGIRGQVRSAMRGVKQELETGADEVKRTSSRWNGAFNIIGAAAKVGMLGIAGAVAAGVAAAVQFESAWAGVRKTVDATPQELEALRQQFRNLAKEIPVSVNELAKIGETAGAMGIAKDNLLEFTKTVALIGQTTNVTTDDAATSLGQLSNVLHLTEDDYSRFAATLVDLGNKGASTESQILEIASRAGSSAGLLKIGAKDVLAYSSAIASLGIEVEAGGTSLQSFFLKANAIVGAGSNLAATAAKGKVSIDQIVGAVTKGGKPLQDMADHLGLTTKKLKELVASSSQLDIMAHVAGMTGEAFAKAFEKDAAGALALFLEGLGKLKGAEQQGILKDLKFSDIRMTRTLLGLANGADLLNMNLRNAAGAWQANTAAEAEAEKRFETTCAQLGLLKNLIQDYLISLGDMALPALKTLLAILRDDLPKAITFLAGIWTRILSPAFGKVGDALGHLGEAVGKIFGSGDKAANWGSVAEKAFTAAANGAAMVAKILATIIDAVAWLLNNPLGQWAARLAAAAAAIMLLMSGTKAIISGLRGTSASLLRGVGLGRLVGPAAAGPEDAAAKALTGSAGELSASAKALEGAAGALKGAAAADATSGGGAPQGPLSPAANRIVNAAPPGGINMLGGGGPSVALGSQEAAIQKAAYQRANAAAQAYARGLAQPMSAAERAAFEGGAYNSGLNLIKNKAADVTSGIKGGLNSLKSAGTAALGFVGKAFWPIMVASIATEIIKAPLGDLVSDNTKFKRVGAQLKEDFFGGLISLVQAWSIGTDAFVGHNAEMKIGTMTFKTMSLAKLGVTSATFDKLEAPVGTIEHAQGVEQAGDKVTNDLAQRAGESVRVWYHRIESKLPEEFKKQVAGLVQMQRFDPKGNEAKAEELGRLLAKQTQTQVTDVAKTTLTEYQNALVDVLVQAGFTKGAVARLNTEQLSALGRVVQLNADGQYNFLVEFMTNQFLGTISSKPAAQVRLSANVKARVDALTKEFGANWEKTLADFATGGATPKPTKANKAIAAKLQKLLGDDWADLLRDTFRSLHPHDTKGAVAGGFTDTIKALQGQTQNVEAAIKAFFNTVPANVKAAIDQVVAQSGETDPEAIKTLRDSLERQWHANIEKGLQAFEAQVNTVDPTVLATLKKKFGDDWVVAMRDGTSAITDKPVDKAVVDEMVKRFGPNWRAALQGFGQLLFEKQGGADAAALKKTLAAALSKQIAALTPEDLTPEGAKKPISKKQSTADKKAIEAYLTSTVGEAALSAAAGPDATAAKKGFEDIGKALSKYIPDEGARNRFIGTMVALQKAATLPTLDSLSSFFSNAVPQASSVLGNVATRLDELAAAGRRFLSATGGGGGGGPANRTQPRGSSARRGASGLIFDTTRETHLTVGEAGNEHVAVLRNFKTFRLPVMAPLPALAMAGASSRPSLSRAKSAPVERTRKVDIHADKFQIFSGADERSVQNRLDFLTAEGR